MTQKVVDCGTGAVTSVADAAFTVPQLKSRRKSEINLFRDQRNGIGILINAVGGPLDDARRLLFGQIATGLLTDLTKTSACWDPVPGAFEEFDRDIFLFAWGLVSKDYSDVNAYALSLMGDVDAISDGEVLATAITALDAIGAEWSLADFNGWPAQVDVAYP